MHSLQKLPTPLRILINHYGFLTAPLVPLAILAVFLGQNGWSLVDFAILAVVVAAVILWWWTQHARQSQNMPASALSLINEIEQSGKYAMLAFESEFCIDRKSTRLNSSHQIISYAVFCLKKKKKYTK